MKLTVFQSDKGDCLLLQGKDTNVLVDGGMRRSYTEHVAPTLANVIGNRQELDVVCVSHIDQDHIAGILQLFDDLADWRVHDFHLENNHRDHPEPKSHRPPEVGEIWHNAFHEQIGRNAGPIEEMLAAVASVLFGADEDELREKAAGAHELAASVDEAIRLSRRVGSEQLGIPLNRPAAGKLMLVREERQPIRRGGLSIWVIGPFARDLEKLRAEWNTWLRRNRDVLKEIREEARADEDRLTDEVRRLADPFTLEAALFGRRGRVTAPNLASLMLFVKEQGTSLLLTGDGHHADVLKGLEHIGKLDGARGIHVDVLKVPHHGSENNMDAAFLKTVSADHYVFCGNGSHENPHPGIVEMVIDSRIGPQAGRSVAAPPNKPFKLWFNSSSEATRDERKLRTHMRALERLVKRRADRSGGRLRYQFLRGRHFTLDI